MEMVHLSNYKFPSEDYNADSNSELYEQFEELKFAFLYNLEIIQQRDEEIQNLESIKQDLETIIKSQRETYEMEFVGLIRDKENMELVLNEELKEMEKKFNSLLKEVGNRDMQIEVLRNEIIQQKHEIILLKNKLSSQNKIVNKYSTNNKIYCNLVEKYKTQNDLLIEKIKIYEERERERKTIKLNEGEYVEDEEKGNNVEDLNNLENLVKIDETTNKNIKVENLKRNFDNLDAIISNYREENFCNVNKNDISNEIHINLEEEENDIPKPNSEKDFINEKETMNDMFLEGNNINYNDKHFKNKKKLTVNLNEQDNNEKTHNLDIKELTIQFENVIHKILNENLNHNQKEKEQINLSSFDNKDYFKGNIDGTENSNNEINKILLEEKKPKDKGDKTDEEKLNNKFDIINGIINNNEKNINYICIDKNECILFDKQEGKPENSRETEKENDKKYNKRDGNEEIQENESKTYLKTQINTEKNKDVIENYCENNEKDFHSSKKNLNSNNSCKDIIFVNKNNEIEKSDESIDKIIKENEKLQKQNEILKNVILDMKKNKVKSIKVLNMIDVKESKDLQSRYEEYEIQPTKLHEISNKELNQNLKVESELQLKSMPKYSISKEDFKKQIKVYKPEQEICDYKLKRQMHFLEEQQKQKWQIQSKEHLQKDFLTKGQLNDQLKEQNSYSTDIISDLTSTKSMIENKDVCLDKGLNQNSSLEDNTNVLRMEIENGDLKLFDRLKKIEKFNKVNLQQRINQRSEDGLKKQTIRSGNVYCEGELDLKESRSMITLLNSIREMRRDITQLKNKTKSMNQIQQSQREEEKINLVVKGKTCVNKKQGAKR